LPWLTPIYFRWRNDPPPEKKELNMSNAANQTQSGSVDPLAKFLVDELRKSGARAWRLGFPSPEEMEQLKAEKAERRFQWDKGRAAAEERRRETLKDGARRNMRREPDYE
jgi:hypothetical protein